MCEECLEERHGEHDMEDLAEKCGELEKQFKTAVDATNQILTDVKVKKSMLKSGKHIDLFFDSLIQSILRLHS